MQQQHPDDQAFEALFIRNEQQVRGRIALIEDGESTRIFIERNLRAQGYHVKCIEDGASALPLLRIFRPDIVLLDVGLPDVSGYKVCAQIKKEPLLQQTTVIMLTGHAGEESRIAGAAAGADDYIIKPCEIPELLARVAAHIRLKNKAREQWLDPITSLPGLAGLESVVAEFIQKKNSFSVIYADIHHFKSYNDRYGYIAGDAFLAAAADIIRNAISAVAEAHQLDDEQQIIVGGHVASDDFAIVTAPEFKQEIMDSITAEFTALAPSMYRTIDRDRGWIPGIEKDGSSTRFPFVTIIIKSRDVNMADFAQLEPSEIMEAVKPIWGQLQQETKSA